MRMILIPSGQAFENDNLLIFDLLMEAYFAGKLGPKETPPAYMLTFIADQRRIDSNDFEDYARQRWASRKPQVPERKNLRRTLGRL